MISGTFTELEYRFTYTPSSANIPASLRFDVDIDAESWVIEYENGEWITAAEEDSSEQYLPDDLDSQEMFYDEGWEAMPNGIQLEDKVYNFRLVTFGTESQARVREITIVDDAPDITEYINDQAILSGGEDLVVTKTYRAITHVSLTLQTVGGETAVNARVNNKDFDGPEVECFDAAGASTDGTLDAFVRGY